MADTPRYLAVATVRRPHGVRGELFLAMDTDRPQAVFRPGRVLRLGDGRGNPLDRSLTVDQARPFKDGMLVRFRELTNLTPEVEALRGHSLLIGAADAAPAGEDEVAYHDLLGMEVSVAGARIGRIHDVLPTAGAELLVIRPPRGKELLVPFVKEMVRGVDLERRVLEIEPPEGLLDL